MWKEKLKNITLKQLGSGIVSWGNIFFNFDLNVQKNSIKFIRDHDLITFGT